MIAMPSKIPGRDELWQAILLLACILVGFSLLKLAMR